MTDQLQRFLAFFIFFLLLGCEAESDPNRAADESNCPAVGDLTIERSSGLGSSARCLISGTLTVNATLPASRDWYLNGALNIGDAASSPLLTIAAGTRVFGNIDGTNADYIYVAPGASLNATGTVLDPIFFSSDDDNYEGPGEWGGLILEDTLAALGQINLQYVVVTEAGAAVTIGANTYTDNIVLEGVHDDTKIQYFQSHDSAGDGFRVQSSSAVGQARLSWLLITGASRDGFSYENFSGLVKDMLVIHRPEIYSLASNTGGRAGIYASGANSLPLFVNVTLAGRDTTSISSVNVNDREFGIIFADNSTQFRLANSIVSNFRHGCYEVDATSDLSGITASGAVMTDSFIDGVHCGHEQSGTIGNLFVRWVLRSGNDADNIPDAERGDGNGDGFRFHGNSTFNFDGEANPTIAITSVWFLNNIGGVLMNDLVFGTGTLLNAYAGGDTDGDSDVDSDDKNFQPLRSNTDAFFASVTGVSGPSQGYDLTVIGVSRSNDSVFAGEFDVWTLQAGGLFPEADVPGFGP